MTKLTHKQKVRLARRMRSRWNIKNHTPIFSTDTWIDRSFAISERGRKMREKKAV